MKEIHLMDNNDMAYELNKLKKGQMVVFAQGYSGTYAMLPTYTKELISRLVQEGRITTAQKRVGSYKASFRSHLFDYIAVGL